MEHFRRGIAGFKEWWRFRQEPAAAEVVKKYRANGGIFLGEEGEPYKLKVTPDKIELIRKNPDEPITDAETERQRVATWAYGYIDIASFTQRYLRVALGLPADIPKEASSTSPEG